MPTKRTRKTPRSWKEAKTLKVFAKKVRLALFSFLVFVLGFSFFWGFTTIKLFSSSIATASNSPFPQSAKWEGTEALNIFFTSKDSKSGVLRLNPENNSVNFVKLGESAPNTTLPVDRYISLKKDSLVKKYLLGDFEEGQKPDLGGYTKFIIEAKEILEKEKGVFSTDLSIEEIARISLFLRNADYREILDLTGKEYLESSGYLQFDAKWRSILFAKSYREEGLKVMVLNGTNKEGLALWGSRKVENLGVLTLDAQNADKIYADSVIFYKNRQSKSLKGISAGLKIDNLVYEEDLSKYAPFGQRADILVVLGLDKI